jgi:hypothetical protein
LPTIPFSEFEAMPVTICDRPAEMYRFGTISGRQEIQELGSGPQVPITV